MQIGFLGTGGMGAAIALRLQAAGHEVHAWNRTPASLQPLLAAGVKAAPDAATAAVQPVVFSMLADDAAVFAVLEQGGALAAFKPGAVHVNMATISVAAAQRLVAAHAARGVGYVAAPVFGRPDAAASGKLHMLAAGAPDALTRVRPLLAAIGQRVWPFGDDPLRANAVKLAGNFMLASAIEAMAEASTLAQAHGVAAADFLGLMSETLFAAPAYKTYGALIAQRRYEPAGFRLRLGFKDISLALAAADATVVPMPFASVLRENFLDALAHGAGERDWSALAEVSARRAGQGAGS
ncbi:NAD(P)-dependent oxidoreductase [Metallibacterium sp.]|uniref:NAD(P)-dependent oxidoreductase n=1 Tax=Metallibacterium sp. TaxID=2940281 RepID=UPI00261F1452|nr:NAD(P)-dependent oxidoreductase [Metallibacterium sp.]